MADLVREWRTADEAAPTLLQGEQVWLHAGSEQFWAIYWETARKESRGTTIILPDPALRPVSSRLVEPLADTLRQFGWQVLVLQPPRADGPFFQGDVNARLDAAMAFLVEKKHKHMALVAMGDSAAMALDYAAHHNPLPPPSAAELELLRQRGEPLPQPKPALRLTAVVDVSWDERGLNAPLMGWLEKIRMPVADYYQAQDGAKPEQWAKQRRIAAKANEAYRQLRFAEADLTAEADRNMLARRLTGWMGNSLRTEVDKWPKAGPVPAVP